MRGDRPPPPGYNPDAWRLSLLAAQGRLLATVDAEGRPFRIVTTVTPHSDGQHIILWLSPTAYDDDLKTPMEDEP